MATLDLKIGADTEVVGEFIARVDLQGENKDGPFQNSTTWDKLIDRDFTSGSGGGCGGGENLICDELPADAVVERRIADSDFQDSNWQVEVVATEGAMYDAPVVRQESSGVDNSGFRHMTHSIEQATNCAESCTVGVVHTITTPPTVRIRTSPAEEHSASHTYEATRTPPRSPPSRTCMASMTLRCSSSKSDVSTGFDR